jgi:hypothetical protein
MKLNNKILLLLVSVTLVNSGSISSQNTTIDTNGDVCGVYMNSGDYGKHNLPLSYACKSSGKLKLHRLFASKYADLVINGRKTRLYKDSIFGYHTCKNEDYRFYKKHDEEYRILENKGVVLYLSYIRVSPYNAKTIQIVPAYFFSKTINSEILPLTMQNLKKTFPDNSKFDGMLDTEFGPGEPLSAYSVNDKMYKVSLLLNKSTLK